MSARKFDRLRGFIARQQPVARSDTLRSEVTTNYYKTQKIRATYNYLLLIQINRGKIRQKIIVVNRRYTPAN